MKRIQILGAGCTKCKTLKQNAEQAVRDLALEASVEKVEDINVITEFGVMTTPALVVDGEVKAVGRLLSVEQIRQLLS